MLYHIPYTIYHISYRDIIVNDGKYRIWIIRERGLHNGGFLYLSDFWTVLVHLEAINEDKGVEGAEPAAALAPSSWLPVEELL
jgi:hypothetical protein